MDTVNICSRTMWCTWIQSHVVDNVCTCGQYVVDNVVCRDTVNTCSGQGGVHGYSQHM